MSNIVIKAESVSKYYRLGVINNGALFKDIQTWWALKLGKHDPHSSIGQNKYDPTKEGFWALSDLNFNIQSGDRVGIIGKNGAGKSTLLKILSRITAPTEGQIKIKGRIASLLEVGTGFHGELTGRENIFLNGAILGMKRREVSRKLDEIIAFSEIEQHIDTPVKRYSSGMYVRLAFAVAAHLDSEILIADEVLAVGDASFQKKALGKMNELSSGQGRTVLFVSHNMGAIKMLCNKGIVLEKGKITCDDGIDKALKKYLSPNSINHEGISERKYQIDENKEFQVIKIQVLNQKAEICVEYESQEEIRIRIHCISRKPIKELYGYLLISKVDGTPFIICDSTENKNNPFNCMQKGEHTVDIKIPSGVLSPGEYTPALNFTSSFTNSFNVDSPLEVCIFNVIDTISSRGANRGALTSLALNWDKKS